MTDPADNNSASPTNTTPTARYDLAVIGAGSAGFSASLTAAEQGAQVALLGFGAIGGTCVNVGCIPSKTMIRAAQALHHGKTAARFAGLAGHAELQAWDALVNQKNALVAQLRQTKYRDLLSAYPNIAYRQGQVRLIEGGVALDNTPIEADSTIIATGAAPTIPDISGIETVNCLTSTQALDLTQRPDSLLVIGGGYIGCELAQMFARAGAAVTLVCRSRLLPEAEPEISTALTGYLRDEGITVADRLAYQAIRPTDQGIALDVRQNGQDRTIRAQQVLAATGRRPNSRGLNLEQRGIELLPNDGIKVNDKMRTSRPGVYAAGDVTGRDPFVYMAAYGAKIAAKNALNGDRLGYDNSAMPWVVFTDPQVAGVGLSEAAAKQRGFAVKTASIRLDQLPRALAARDTRGLIKLVADKKTNKLLGAQLLAPEGADSIQTAAMAIRCGLTVGALADSLFPYLTTVEGLRLAAQAFDRDITKLSCCAG